jgi:hypothetical protein
LWSDLILETKSDGIYSYRFASSNQGILSHSTKQWPTLCDRYIHMKIDSPWYFKEKSGVKFLWNSAKWNHLNNDLNIINILPGCLEFKDQMSTNINMFLPKADNKFFVPHNTPLAHIIPITENDVEIKNHLISKTEWHDMLATFTGAISFNNNYNNLAKLRKSKENSKCPFGFK